ncbi:MAG: D-glycero-beta-D-manno-heptose 1-phosphate adenylyltransferase [Flavobacteriales bacterium]
MSNKWKNIKKKCYTKEDIISISKDWKKQGTVVFSNGCFDILHPGHIHYLSKAAELGDKLIIGLNSDQSVSVLKGPTRPYNNENDRQIMLASLDFVNAVVLFDQETPIDLITQIKPDFLVKGGDYAIDQIVGNKIVKENGGKVVSLDFLSGYSTSLLIDKIQNGQN